MRTREAIKRLRQLADAIAKDNQYGHTNLPDSIRRTLLLIEACPWIVDGDVIGEVVAKVEKKAKEPAK